MRAERTPPWAEEAEVAVLGACLFDAKALPVVLEVLDAETFYRDSHRRIFRAMTALFQAGTPIEPVTVSERLRKTDELEYVGGMSYLAELLDAVPTAANVAYHAGIVRDTWLRRRLIEAGTEAVRDGYEPGERATPELLDAAQARLMELAVSGGGGLRWLKQMLYPAFAEIERRQGTGGITGLATGFRHLDRALGGMQRKDLIILAARPSMGKTALAVGMALHAAVYQQTPVAMFSLEMSNEQLVHRMLCTEGLVDLGALLRGELQKDDYDRLAQAATNLNTAPVWLDDESGLSVLQVRSTARRAKTEHPDLGLIVVDHMGLLSGKGENRTQELGNISMNLKGMAKELDVPVLALCQLSRAPEQRGSRRPVLSDLRESGRIEEDADVVLLLYREEYYLTPAEARERNVTGQAEIIVAKNRNGPTGPLKLYYRKECVRFEEPAEEWRVEVA